MRPILSFLICVFILGSSFLTFASDESLSGSNYHISQEMTDEDPVKTTLLYQEESIQQGHPFWVAIEMKIADHWHLYWKNPGDSGMAPSVEWTLPEGFSASEIFWPAPKKFVSDSLIGYGFEDKLVLLAQITPSKNMTNLTNAKIDANVRWVVCSDSTCLPGSTELSTTLPISSSTPALKEEWGHLFTQAHQALPKKAQATVARKQNSLEIVLNDPEVNFSTYTKAHFFPEQNDLIDAHDTAIAVPSKENPHKITITLKETENSLKASQLQGVIYLENHNSANKSYDLSNSVLGAADPQQVGSMMPMEFEGGLGLALVLAFVGGLILNFMPCVLPVISFKVLSFVKMAGQSRKLIMTHGLSFTFGVLISFWILTAALLILQAYGRSVGWGFQLQEPLFVAGLAAVLLIFGLSLFGVFELGTSLISFAGQAQHKATKNSSLFSSFMSGVLATAVATPCTGPFLGSAVGFAVTLPPALTLLVFTSLGLGMALPYLVLASFPSMLRFLPKPGNWMVTFKELMGFVMLATVLWLVWVFGAQTSTFALFLLLAGFFFLALGSWIYGKWGMSVQRRTLRAIGYLLVVICFATGGYAIANSASPWASAIGAGPDKAIESGSADAWEEFSPERIAELQKQGVPVFVDFTAKWCLICQANHLILSTNEVHQHFSTKGVVKMKADWTKNDPVITAELRKFGRSGVPLYVLYGNDPKEAPKILPQVLTPETVVGQLKNIVLK